MKHYAKIQRRLSLYDRQLFRGDSLLAANYYKIKYDTTYISRPHARWTIKLRGNLLEPIWKLRRRRMERKPIPR